MEKTRLLASIKYAGVALVLGTALSVAQARTTNLGTLSSGDYGFSELVRPGHSFNDLVRFRLDDASQVASFIQTFDQSLLSFNLLNIGNFSASLQKLGSGGFHTLSTSSGSSLSFDDLLGPGRYRIALSGDSNGIFGGMYGGTLHVAAVPEADTWVMLLVGLGIVAYQLRRKQRSLALQPLAA